MEYINLIITHLVSFIEHIVTAMGPLGISLLMAIESCNIPLPSEAILPFAGFIVSKGEMNFHLAAWAGAFGCVLGSIPSYYLGFFGGRKFVEKYGKYFLISLELIVLLFSHNGFMIYIIYHHLLHSHFRLNFLAYIFLYHDKTRPRSLAN